jgi:hypothetical protein
MLLVYARKQSRRTPEIKSIVNTYSSIRYPIATGRCMVVALILRQGGEGPGFTAFYVMAVKGAKRSIAMQPRRADR